MAGNIRTYTADAKLTPDESGQRSIASGAVTQGILYDQAGQAYGDAVKAIGGFVEKHLATQEVSHGAMSLATLQSNLVQSWNAKANDPNTDPNDPSTAQKWREEVLQPAMEKWQDSFHTDTGAKWAQSQTLQFNQHMAEKTGADMATMQGNALVTNLQQTQSTLTDLAHRDPTSADVAMGTLSSSVEALIQAHPGMTPELASKMRNDFLLKGHSDIAKAAMVGIADQNPEMAKKLLDSQMYDQYLDANEKKGLATYADGISKEQVSEARAAAAERTRVAKQQGDVALSQITAQNTNPDTGELTPSPGYFKSLREAAIGNPLGVSASDLRAATAAGQKALEDHSNRTLVQDDPQVYNDFASRATLADSDPRKLTANEVYSAYLSGHLSNKSQTVLVEASRKASQDPANTEAEKNMKSFLESTKTAITKSNPLLGKVDTTGDQMYYSFEYDLRQSFNRLVAAGKSPAEASDALINPRSPTFFGNQIPQYATSMKSSQSQIKSFTSGAGQVAHAPILPAAQPRMPNESAADYLKRTGGK